MLNNLRRIYHRRAPPLPMSGFRVAAAYDGEPEITALTTNLSSITEAVTAGGSPQWFADRLIEKAFITRQAARGIRDTSGISPAVQASKLMDSVFAKINGSDNKSHWFDKFVDIFSHDRAYAELVERLKHTTSTAGKVHIILANCHAALYSVVALWLVEFLG